MENFDVRALLTRKRRLLYQSQMVRHVVFVEWVFDSAKHKEDLDEGKYYVHEEELEV
jgi:hypothetical protein